MILFSIYFLFSFFLFLLFSFGHPAAYRVPGPRIKSASQCSRDAINPAVPQCELHNYFSVLIIVRLPQSNQEIR